MVASQAESADGTGFRGVFLVCQDLRRSLDFYLSLGLSQTRRTNRSAVVSWGQTALHLHDRLSAEEEETYGVRWQQATTGLVLLFSTDDLERVWQQAPDSAKLLPPRNTPWGDRIAMLQDPDGYRLEFRQESL